jgi:cell division septation protein DedD
MSTLALLTILLSSASPSPTDIRDDLDAHPWRPDPAAAPAKASYPPAPGAAPKASATGVATKDSSHPSSGSWQVQLGALSSQDAANTEKRRLEKILGAGSVETTAEKGIFKLRYGRFPSKDAAEAARADLKAKGIDGFSVSRP